MNTYDMQLVSFGVPQLSDHLPPVLHQPVVAPQRSPNCSALWIAVLIVIKFRITYRGRRALDFSDTGMLRRCQNRCLCHNLPT